MKNPLKNERGSALVIEIIVLAVVLAAAGFAAYNYFQHKHQTGPAQPSVSQKPSTSPSASPSPTPDPYSGWSTYKSKTEGLSFRYPPGWKFENSGASEPADDGGSFIGPDNLEVDWNSAVSGIGGACDKQTEPHIFFYQITRVPAVPSDYLVELGKGNISSLDIVNTQYDTAVPLRVGDTGECLFYPLFKSKDGTRSMWLQGQSIVNGRPQPLTTNQITVLQKILLSVTY